MTAFRRGWILILVVSCAFALPAVADGATIKVTTLNDELDPVPDASCSLREAVASASTDGGVGGCPVGDGADTIKLTASQYSLNVPTTNENANVNGDLDVLGGKVTFLGKGDDVTAIRTDLEDRLVDIHDGAKVTFKNIRLFSGDVSQFSETSARGGNVRAGEGGSITLLGVASTDGTAYGGGSIYMNATGSPGKLKITRSIISDNDASGIGGGIDVLGDVTSKISKSTISNNTVTDDSGSSDAGGISNRGTKMTITDTELSENDVLNLAMSSALGGAILNDTGSELVVRRSLFEANTANAASDNAIEAGGAILSSGDVTVTNTTFFHNGAGLLGHGAVLYGDGGTSIVANSTLIENGQVPSLQAQTGSLLVRNSILQGNPCQGQAVESGGFNVASADDAACQFGAKDITDAPEFGLKSTEPEANGGSTETFALKKSSPAVDLIPKNACGVAEGEDQRGYERPKKNCDSGAYERKAKKPKKR